MSLLSHSENLQPADSPFTFHPALAYDPALAAQFLHSDFAARDRVMAGKHSRNAAIAMLSASFPALRPIRDVETGVRKPARGSLATRVRDVMDVTVGEEHEACVVDEETELQTALPSGWTKIGAHGNGNGDAAAAKRGEGWNVGDSVPADAKSLVRFIGKRHGFHGST